LNFIFHFIKIGRLHHIAAIGTIDHIVAIGTIGKFIAAIGTIIKNWCENNMNKEERYSRVHRLKDTRYSARLSDTRYSVNRPTGNGDMQVCKQQSEMENAPSTGGRKI